MTLSSTRRVVGFLWCVIKGGGFGGVGLMFRLWRERARSAWRVGASVGIGWGGWTSAAPVEVVGSVVVGYDSSAGSPVLDLQPLVTGCAASNSANSLSALYRAS